MQISNFTESKLEYSPEEYRFTCKKDTIFTFAMGKPEKDPIIRCLGKKTGFTKGKINKITLLGYGEVAYKQENKALTINLPKDVDLKNAYCFKIEGLQTNMEKDQDSIYIAK